jgi:hypothetical protein
MGIYCLFDDQCIAMRWDLEEDEKEMKSFKSKKKRIIINYYLLQCVKGKMQPCTLHTKNRSARALLLSDERF